PPSGLGSGAKPRRSIMEVAANRRQAPFFLRLWRQFVSKSDLRGQSIARNPRHDLAKTIQFPQRGVDVWCDSQPGKFRVNDGRGEDPVLVEEVAADFPLIETFDLHIRDSAHLLRIERGVKADFGDAFEPIHPVT